MPACVCQKTAHIVLYNGALECEFRKYQVFEGKLKERREEGMDIKSSEDRQRNLKFKKKRPTSPDPSQGGEKGEVSEPRLNRHNFKWGDRSADYRPDNDTHYFKSRPFDKKPAGRTPKEYSGKPKDKTGKPKLRFDSEGRPIK